jgi:hypothetical protein
MQFKVFAMEHAQLTHIFNHIHVGSLSVSKLSFNSSFIFRVTVPTPHCYSEELRQLDLHDAASTHAFGPPLHKPRCCRIRLAVVADVAAEVNEIGANGLPWTSQSGGQMVLRSALQSNCHEAIKAPWLARPATSDVRVHVYAAVLNQRLVLPQGEVKKL